MLWGWGDDLRGGALHILAAPPVSARALVCAAYTLVTASLDAILTDPGR